MAGMHGKQDAPHELLCTYIFTLKRRDVCRGDPSGRGLSRVDSLALKANAANAARMHDTGRILDPSRDISHHYRPHRGYSGSFHGGNIYNTMGDSMHSQEGSVRGKKSGRKGLPRNFSTPGLARAESMGGGGSQRGPQVCFCKSQTFPKP